MILSLLFIRIVRHPLQLRPNCFARLDARRCSASRLINIKVARRRSAFVAAKHLALAMAFNSSRNTAIRALTNLP
jgi:hypothetical protein